jgi:hypothetical protein
VQSEGELRPWEREFLAASTVREARRERAWYLGQAAGGAIGTGLGYAVALALATYSPPDPGGVAGLTALLTLTIGQFVGLCIGIGLYVWRNSAVGRVAGPTLIGAAAGAASWWLFLSFLGERGVSPALHRLAVGAYLGAGVGLGVALPLSGWRRLVATTLGGLMAVGLARVTGGLPSPPDTPWPAAVPATVAAGLALGLVAGLGFESQAVATDELPPTALAADERGSSFNE